MPPSTVRRPTPRAPLGTVLTALLVLPGCFAVAPSEGGGETRFEGERRLDQADVALPDGYRIEVVATGLTFPTGVAFDDRGRPHVTEAGYSYGPAWAVPRLVRVEPDGSLTEVVRGDDGPWNGLTYHDGAFYVAAAGHRDGGRILRIAPDGTTRVVIDGLPSLGDHHTNGPVAGSDGFLYFGQGTATNAGVVGLDNFEFGWVERHPEFHDIPCRDIVLAGRNYRTSNPLDPDGGEAVTGAFVPFGTPTRAGEVVRGALPCSGAILRVRTDGGALELVAWGLRNPFGLAFDPDGALYVTENQYDARGSRKVFGTGDLFWRIESGTWYGWPDYFGRRPLTDADWFEPPGGETPGFLLAEHPQRPPAPAAVLGVHSSSNGFDFSRSAAFGHVGQAFIAQFGDMAPGVGDVWRPVGFKVVRVDPGTGRTHDFAVNRGRTLGPASWQGSAGLERPVAARFDPEGRALYVVDFGVMTVGERPEPRPGTGVLWRILRVGAP